MHIHLVENCFLNLVLLHRQLRAYLSVAEEGDFHNSNDGRSPVEHVYLPQANFEVGVEDSLLRSNDGM